MNIRSIHTYVVAVLLVIGLSGCALTTDRIDIAYRPADSAVRLAEAQGVKVMVQVRDQRIEKTKVSSKKNGFGMELAPIVATQEVAGIVKKAIESELQVRGFQVVPEQRS